MSDDDARPINRRRLMALVGGGLILSPFAPSVSQAQPAGPMASRSAAAPSLCGAVTRAGLERGGAVIARVTTLDDAGPGSLRDAVRPRDGRPTLVVFDVGGVIALRSPLDIARNDLWIAGQTAPGAGVALHGRPVIVRGSRVIIEHLRSRPGSPASVEASRNNDAWAIRATGADREDVLLRNCSGSWSSDEIVDVGPRGNPDGPGFRNVRVSLVDCLFAEALKEPEHAHEPFHHLGVLIARGVEAALLAGCVIAGCPVRTPMFASGASGAVVGCYVFDFWGNGFNGPSALTVNMNRNRETPQARWPDRRTRLTVLRCVCEAGPQTAASGGASQHYVQDRTDGARFEGDNGVELWEAECLIDGDAAVPAPPRPWVRTLPHPSLWFVEGGAARDVKQDCLKHAGALPARRDATDARIVASLRSFGPDTPAALRPTLYAARPPDDEPPPTTRRATIPPERPFAIGADGLTAAERWLYALHLESGGRAWRVDRPPLAPPRPAPAAPVRIETQAGGSAAIWLERAFEPGELWLLRGAVDPSGDRPAMVRVTARPTGRALGTGAAAERTLDWSPAQGAFRFELAFVTTASMALRCETDAGVAPTLLGWSLERLGRLGPDLLDGPETVAQGTRALRGAAGRILLRRIDRPGPVALSWPVALEGGVRYALLAAIAPMAEGFPSFDVRIATTPGLALASGMAGGSYAGLSAQRLHRLWRAPVSVAAHVGVASRRRPLQSGEGVALEGWRFSRLY